MLGGSRTFRPLSFSEQHVLVFGGGWGSGVPRRIRMWAVQKDVWMGGSETYKDWECSERRLDGGAPRRLRIGNVQKCV